MVATRSGRSEPELATAPGQQPARDTFLDDLAAEMLKEVTAVTKQYSNEVEDEDVALVRAKALEWRPGTALPALDKSQLPVKMPGASSLAKLVRGRKGCPWMCGFMLFQGYLYASEPFVATRRCSCPPLVHLSQDHLPPLTGKRSIRAARAEVPDTSGKRWYNMPAPQITEEVKRDLRMIRLRYVVGRDLPVNWEWVFHLKLFYASPGNTHA